MSKKQDYVNLLVYGTLKRNGKLSSNLQGATFIKEEIVTGFEMFNLGWFPGIKPGNGKISGEIYSIPISLLPILDSVEGVPYLYKRETISTSLGDTFVYVYQGDPEPGSKVEGGTWNVKL